MKIRVAIHGWFQNKAGWAFHPEIDSKVRRQLIDRLGQETRGEAGPIVPRPLHGDPSYYIVGTRAEGQVAVEGERPKPILRLALLPGQPRSRDDAEAFLNQLGVVPAAGPGNDEALQLEWEGDLIPLADVAELRTEPTPRRRPGPFATAVAFVILAALVAGVWMGRGWLRTTGGRP